MDNEKLTCTKVVAINNGKDLQGKPVVYYKKCGRPASEVEIGGILGKAKAILCERCKSQADRQSFVSVNGYPLGKISKKGKKDGYQQPQLPGTGVIK